MLVCKYVFVYICIVEKLLDLHCQAHLLILPIEGVLISALTSSPPLYRVCPTGPNPTRLLPPNTESACEGLALSSVVSEARHSADALQVSLERVGG